MNMKDVMRDEDYINRLTDGAYAADPLMPQDAGMLLDAWACAEPAFHRECGLRAEFERAIAAAYSLGARHALEQTERWTLAPAAECDDEETIDLAVDVQAPPVDSRNWRGWEELTDRERCLALRARPTISVREASECLWAQVENGWDVAYPAG